MRAFAFDYSEAPALGEVEVPDVEPDEALLSVASLLLGFEDLPLTLLERLSVT